MGRTRVEQAEHCSTLNPQVEMPQQGHTDRVGVFMATLIADAVSKRSICKWLLPLPAVYHTHRMSVTNTHIHCIVSSFPRAHTYALTQTHNSNTHTQTSTRHACGRAGIHTHTYTHTHTHTLDLPFKQVLFAVEANLSPSLSLSLSLSLSYTHTHLPEQALRQY